MEEQRYFGFPMGAGTTPNLSGMDFSDCTFSGTTTLDEPKLVDPEITGDVVFDDVDELTLTNDGGEKIGMKINSDGDYEIEEPDTSDTLIRVKKEGFLIMDPTDYDALDIGALGYDIQSFFSVINSDERHAFGDKKGHFAIIHGGSGGDGIGSQILFKNKNSNDNYFGAFHYTTGDYERDWKDGGSGTYARNMLRIGVKRAGSLNYYWGNLFLDSDGVVDISARRGVFIAPPAWVEPNIEFIGPGGYEVVDIDDFTNTEADKVIMALYGNQWNTTDAATNETKKQRGVAIIGKCKATPTTSTSVKADLEFHVSNATTLDSNLLTLSGEDNCVKFPTIVEGLTYIDANGKFLPLTLGTDLSYSAGVLNATGDYDPDPTFDTVTVSSTDSDSISTAGGIVASGDIQGDGLSLSSAISTSGVATIGGRIRTLSSTGSTSPTTGCIIADGGAGIAENLYVGGLMRSTGNCQGDNVISDGYLSCGTYCIASGYIRTLDATQATSYSTGSLRANGGAGITKNLYVGEDLDVQGDATIHGDLTVSGTVIGDKTIDGDLTVTGTIETEDTTSTSSPTTGALVVAGGVGIGNGLHVDGILHVVDETQSTSTTTGSFHTDGGAGIVKNVNVGGGLYVLGPQIFQGNTTLNGNVGVNMLTASTSPTTGALTVAGGVGIGGAAHINDMVKVYSVTNSTSPTTGACVIAGGCGIAKDLYIGGDSEITGDLGVTGDSTLSGDLQLDGDFVMPNQSGAIAYRSTTDRIFAWTPGPTTFTVTVECNNDSEYDPNGEYNTTTGKYTVPTNGLYLITGSIYLEDDDPTTHGSNNTIQKAWVHIYKNSSALQSAMCNWHNTTPNEWSGDVTTPAKLAANDEITLRLTPTVSGTGGCSVKTGRDLTNLCVVRIGGDSS